jgi:tetratricopeptide (TPR) repeat protein
MTSLRSKPRCRPFIVLALSTFFLPLADCQNLPASVAADFPATSHTYTPQTLLSITPELQGDILCARQRYLDAIKAYLQAPQDSAVVANKIGVAYHHMFDMVDARKYYQRAIQLDPKFAEPVNNLGATYHAEKNFKEAERLYRKAIQLQPHSAAFYSNLGTAYFFENNVKKGSEAFQQAFALDPEVFERATASKIEESSSKRDLANVNYTLAKTYARAGRNERALAYLRKAVGEGFSDRKHLMKDPELAAVRETPEFAQLLNIQRGN